MTGSVDFLFFHYHFVPFHFEILLLTFIDVRPKQNGMEPIVA